MKNIIITIPDQGAMTIHISRGLEHRNRHQVHRDKTKYRRKDKHKGRGEDR